MATRLPAPTEEELAEAERKIQEKRDIEEFEANRAALEARRPKGAAKLSSARTFRISTPPLTRGTERAAPEEEAAEDETPAAILRRANNGQSPAAPTAVAKPKTKSRFEVTTDAKGDPIRNTNTVIKGLGVLYVEERKKDPTQAFQNLRDSIMMNLDVLIPAMPQIKQMFELLQIGEPQKEKGGDRNGKETDIGNSMKKLQHFLRGEDEDE